jgi:hypothetical protein
VAPLRWQDTLWWLILYIITWLLGAAVLFAVASFFQVVPVTRFLHLVGIWSLAGTVSLGGFVTISIIGLREISLALLLLPLFPLPVTVLIAVTIRLVWLVGELVAALVALRPKSPR